MPRAGEDRRVPVARPRRHGVVAPAPMRVILAAALSALPVAVVGGHDGFWLCLPGVLLAASIGASTTQALLCAAPVAIASAVVAHAVPGGRLPPLGLVLLVPLACVLVLEVISGRLQRERDVMERAAFTDPLTKLANRRMLMMMAEYEIARHERSGMRFVAVMLDLDGFKLLNDRYGHAAGDQMLRDVADALSRLLRSQDTVARLGGDEFCVIAPETDNPGALADKIAAAVAAAASGYDGLSTSVGFAAFPDDGSDIESLLEVADERLLMAKRQLYGQRRFGAQRRRRAA